MEFNPYQAPRSTLVGESQPVVGRLYIAANYLYAFFILGCTCILFASRPPPLNLFTLLAALYFYAPICCFALLRWGPPRHFNKVLAGYGIYVAILVGILVWNLVSPNRDLGIGLVIVGINAVGLVAASLAVRPKKSSKPTPIRGPA